MNIQSSRNKKVLVVDDSALMRQLLTHMINEADGLEVIEAAPDPIIARRMIKELNPDVITLDIEMPKMDGVDFLTKIMTLRPMPVVMISSLTQENADVTLRALEIGAVDYVGKPTSNLGENLVKMKDDIVAKVRAAANAKVQKFTPTKTVTNELAFSTTEQILAIGASTGGVQAISKILSEMPANAPATVIVQHMPEEFTTGFARRLNEKTKLMVSEARNGARIIPGHVFVSPGGKHLEIKRSGANYICHLTDGEKYSGHRPSIDVLFRSVAKNVGNRAIGVILTGMGRDGAEGLLHMRKQGAFTIGQDEASSTVYGMCRQAFEVGAVQNQLPLNQIPKAILNACQDVNSLSA